jgi:hypothetical protein
MYEEAMSSSSHCVGSAERQKRCLLTDDDLVLLDLFDGERPAWARLSSLDDVDVFRPDVNEVVTAA